MEQVVERGNMWAAYERVLRNKARPVLTACGCKTRRRGCKFTDPPIPGSGPDARCNGAAAETGHAARQAAVAAATEDERRVTGVGRNILQAMARGAGVYDGHPHRAKVQPVSPNSSRPISMRRISEVPAPISYSLASRQMRPVA